MSCCNCALKVLRNALVAIDLSSAFHGDEAGVLAARMVEAAARHKRGDALPPFAEAATSPEDAIVRDRWMYRAAAFFVADAGGEDCPL